MFGRKKKESYQEIIDRLAVIEANIDRIETMLIRVEDEIKQTCTEAETVTKSKDDRKNSMGLYNYKEYMQKRGGRRKEVDEDGADN